MRREERVTVQGPVKEQQPDGMSHRGGVRRWLCLHPLVPPALGWGVESGARSPPPSPKPSARPTASLLDALAPFLGLTFLEVAGDASLGSPRCTGRLSMGR